MVRKVQKDEKRSYQLSLHKIQIEKYISGSKYAENNLGTDDAIHINQNPPLLEFYDFKGVGAGNELI